MFAQIIRGRVADPSAVRDLAERWHSELAPAARGWLGSTGGVSEDGELFVLVRFESAAAAAANSDRPEQDRWWAAMAGLLVGEVTSRTVPMCRWTSSVTWTPPGLCRC